VPLYPVFITTDKLRWKIAEFSLTKALFLTNLALLFKPAIKSRQAIYNRTTIGKGEKNKCQS
jgi:hypothetical protein